MEDMAVLDMASKFSVFFVPIRIGGVSDNACPQKLQSCENLQEQYTPPPAEDILQEH